MRYVFVVGLGDGGEYWYIAGIFSTREKADEFVRSFKLPPGHLPKDVSIDEWPLDKPKED